VIDDEMGRGGDDPGPESTDIDNQHPRRIPEAIRDDLRRRNDGSAESLADFKPANPDIIVIDMDRLFEEAPGALTADLKFREQHSDAWGYVWASRPGYSEDGRSAVVTFHGDPPPHGSDWVYMLAREGRRWEVQWRHHHYHE
jgi:hypothetical protein